MSILQEYREIRKDIGEETYNAIEKYLKLHPDLYLSDIYYKRAEWEKFEEWNKENIKINEEMEDFWNDVYEGGE